ncbi:hypothetical protein X975_25038, partial [Stegodyphus mimosarum]
MIVHGNIDVNQFLTGHGRFPVYLKRFKIQDCDQCPTCKTVADGDHFLYKCSIFKEVRRKYGIIGNTFIDVREHVDFVEAVLSHINSHKLECGVLI